MIASDFEYDGRYLSDFGFIICDFNNKNDVEAIAAGSQITFNTVPMYHGRSYSLVGTKYDECISVTFQICKNPCEFEDLRITNDEFRNIYRWLNRKEFLPFHLVNMDDQDSVEREPCFYDGSFNISKILFGQTLYGIELSMSTNKPFGYGEPVTIQWDCNDTSVPFTVEDMSDEIGFSYPYMRVSILEDGDLTIKNDMGECTSIIRGCTTGEIITLYNEQQIIETSKTSHDICNSFNYDFFKIGNVYMSRKNDIYTSLRCHVEMSYRPIIKDIPV